jgi:hypothetical protein
MADTINRPSRSYRTDRDDGGHKFDEDPLVELARIVSDDGSFFQSAPAKPANSPESGTRPDPFSADLEAELMDQFEASFASEAAAAADVAHPGEPEPAPVVESQSEHAQYAASDSQALGAMTTAADMRPEEVISTEYERTGVYEVASADDRFTSLGSAGQAENDPSVDPPIDPPSGPLGDLSGNTPVDPAVEPVHDPYRVAPDAAIADAATGEPSANAFEMEFAEALADTASPPLTEDFTPEFGVEAYGRDPEFQDAQASGDEFVADESGYPASHYASEEAGGEADDVYESGMAMPPPAPARSGGRKGLIAVAGVLAVVVLGGGVAAYMGILAPNDPTMPAPVIKAETGDVKIMADATDTARTEPSVLDQLAGQQAKSEEKLIDRIEEPQQIARVVLPGPANEDATQLAKPVGEPAEEPSGSVTDAIAKTIDRVMQEPQQPAAAPRNDPIGPRKVRTVVVKPDGSIVSNDVASAPAQPALPAKPSLPPLEPMEVASVNSTQPPEPTPVKTKEIASVPAPGETFAISGSGDAANVQDPAPQPTQVANTEPLAPVTDVANAGVTTDSQQAMAAPAGLVPRPKPANIPDATVAHAPTRQVTRSTARSTSEPVNLLAAPAETDQPRVTASTAPAASGFVVQVSSQRSAEQAKASFASMKRRYKSVLGGFDPDIQRADLGARGTYYRVRVGPMASREAALRLCEQLKSAGGNCFVTR